MLKKFPTPIISGGRALAPGQRTAEPISEADSNYISGKIQAQYVRCGKTNCHCAQGELHGPYFYRIWRDGMRTRKVYVKPDEVEAVRAVCEENSQRMASLRQYRQLRRVAYDELRGVWRATQALLRAGSVD